MALVDKIPELLSYINKNKPYLESNRVKLDIYDGNLIGYVIDALARTLSENYFKKIEERILPINVLPRITQKSAKSYETKPTRLVDAKYEEIISSYENAFFMNTKMESADVYSHLFKGYALEPFLHEGKPKLRVLPYDRFLPYSDDKVDETNMTIFIKFMGKRVVTKLGKDVVVEVFHAYSKDEFVSFDSEGDLVSDDMVLNEGVNPFGVIPFYYGNRGNDILLPVQDTDIVALTKMIPMLLTDLSGAILFQCFSIMWGIDINAENLTMSPNAFWSLKSDITSNKTPSVGTIKPEADIDKVISFVMTTFALWLETKGIRAGSIGTVDATSLASGVSKLIDEMDTTSIVIKSQTSFSKEESEFWKMFARMNNYWVANSLLLPEYNKGIFGDDFNVQMLFDQPEPMQDRKTMVETQKLEMDAGFTTRKIAITKLNPDMTPEQIDELVLEIENESTIDVTEDKQQQING